VAAPPLLLEASHDLPPAAVDVVGKYRYEVQDASGEVSLPVIVDVILVGRTKILKLHSPL
jgi:hypothetical protein